jgi:malate synthase
MTSTVNDTHCRVLGPLQEGYDQILTSDAMEFVAELARRFAPRVDELLERRRGRQAEIDGGQFPDFSPMSREIRESDWRVGEIPADLMDRRVEITGPADRKMIINALNSGAKVFMADFEDSLTPTWDNLVQGQINLRDALARTISFRSPEGKEYRLKDEVATLIVRPRGWHLREKHVALDGKAIPGALFDFGLYLYHCARPAQAIGSGP